MQQRDLKSIDPQDPNHCDPVFDPRLKTVR